METRANYILVGSFVLLLLIGGLGFLAWLAQVQWDQEFDSYLLVFDGDVTGLSVGSSVRFSGVPIGEVKEIDLDSTDPQNVRVIIEVEGGTPVRADTVASLGITGLTGARFVQLSGGTAGAGEPVVPPGERFAVIPTQLSPIEQVIEGAPDVVTALNRILLRVEDLTSPENVAKVDRILENAAATAANLNDASAVAADMARDLRHEAGQLVVQAETTLAAIQHLADDARQTSSDTRATVEEVRSAAAAVASMAESLGNIAEDNREPLRDFTAAGLQELARLLAEMRRLVVTLNQVTTELQRDAPRFIFGDPQDGYEPAGP